MTRMNGLRVGVRPVASIVLVAASQRPVRAQMCANVPSGGGESIDASIVRVDNSCAVTSGKHVLKSTQMRVDIAATANGSCMIMMPRCWPLPCVCVYSGTTQQRTVNHGEVVGLDAVYPTQPNYFYFSPSNQFQHTLDSHNFNTTGPVTWLPLSAGRLWNWLARCHQHHGLQHATSPDGNAGRDRARAICSTHGRPE